MAKPTKEKIEKEVEKLHKFVRENIDDDPINSRIAYAVAEALRWSIYHTSWENPLAQAISNGNILKEELSQNQRKAK